MAIIPQAGYIKDPNNPNAVIKADSVSMPGSIQSIQQPQPSITYGAINNPIPVSTLSSNQTPITFQNPNANYFNNIGSSAIAGATTPPQDTLVPEKIQTPKPPEQAPQLSKFQNLLSKYLPSSFQMTAPSSTVEEYNKLQAQYDIAGKTKEVNDLNAQLAEIKNKYDLTPIVMEKAAAGNITTDILNRQSGQRQRDYAIEALPVTAALNAAQGRLDSANKNIQTLVNLIQTDQQNTYKYQSDLLSRAMEFASADQKAELQNRQDFLSAQKVEQAQFNTIKNGYVDAAIKAGDYATAGKMATAQDESALQLLVSQIRNTNPDLQFVSGTDNQPAGYFNKTTGQFTPLRIGGGTNTQINSAGLTPEQQSDPFIQKMLATKGGKALTDTPLQQINKGLTVLGQLGALQTNINNIKTGPILGAFKGANPWDTNAQTIKAQLNAVVPNLARGIYGEVGVLTDNDIKTYSKTIGNLKSTNDVNNAIMYITLDLIGKSIKNTLAVQAAGGRDVSKFVDIYTEMENTKNSILQSLPTQTTTTGNSGTTSSGVKYTIVGETPQTTQTPTSNVQVPKIQTNWKSMLPDLSNYQGFTLNSFLK